MEFLPRPEIISRGMDHRAVPPLDVLTLHWNADAPGAAERTWRLPGQVDLRSEAPERFGIAVDRTGADLYRVEVVWNDLRLSWTNLTANQIMTGSLAHILRALGNDLWHMLGQAAPLAA